MCITEKNILVVEDDMISLKILRTILGKYGFQVLEAYSGKDATGLLMNHDIIGVILDLNLPDTSGFEVLKFIRNHSNNRDAAILIVTENDDRLDAIVGLEMGADDYITKPFHQREFVARLNATLRRVKATEARNSPIITLGNLEIDIEKRLVKNHDEIISLSFKEFEILYLLASNPGKVISREAILDEIGGLYYGPGTRVIDMHISSIRKKLGDTKNQKRYIDTVSGVGYRFRE